MRGTMQKDKFLKNLRHSSFKMQTLSFVNFSHCDLTSADLTGADLTGANLSNVKTGISPRNITWIFLLALIISALSGYFAMLAGATIHRMLESETQNVRVAGYACLVIILVFVGVSVWKGIGSAVRTFVVPVSLVAVAVGILARVSGAGSGEGVLYLILSLLFVVVMFVVGTIARSIAGSMSHILFVAVAVFGSLFGRSVGGGIGTIVMALACARISKRALNGAEGFQLLRQVASAVTRRFGTSFRKTNLSYANFSGSTVRNTDFSGANLTFVNWADCVRVNCILDSNKIPTDQNKRKKVNAPWKDRYKLRHNHN